MRVGVSSRGSWWVSMGPLGWILFGLPYLLIMLTVACLWLLGLSLVTFCVAIVDGVAWLVRPRAS